MFSVVDILWIDFQFGTRTFVYVFYSKYCLRFRILFMSLCASSNMRVLMVDYTRYISFHPTYMYVCIQHIKYARVNYLAIRFRKLNFSIEVEQNLCGATLNYVYWCRIQTNRTNYSCQFCQKYLHLFWNMLCRRV